MKLRATVISEHPVVFIYDPTAPYEPQPELRQLITATPSCIAVATMPSVDGEITVELGVSISRPLGDLVFEGKLQTPGGRIVVAGSDTVSILSLYVRDSVTGIKIWANDPEWPDLIQILVEENVFPEEAPFWYEMEGVDRATAKRLIDAAQKFDAAAAEIEQIASNIDDPVRKSRLKLVAGLAASDIQDGIVQPAKRKFPDLI